MYDVSIIVPVYNVEKFIEKCAVTLFEQDYKNIEYIFVNDCSPDNSMQILSNIIRRYPDRQSDIKIINNKINQGLQQTRKIGIDNANGEYVLCVDSDDWMQLNAIGFLYKQAKITNADIVIFDICCEYKNKSTRMNGAKSFLDIGRLDKYGLIKESLKINILSSICAKLVRKYIYDKINFSNFSYAEDFYISMQLLFYANNVKYINKVFYHYDKTNEISLSTFIKFDKIFNDLKALNNQTLSFINKHNLNKGVLEAYYVGLIIYVFYNVEFDILKTLKDINPNAAKIKYVWANNNFNLLKKISCSLVFLKLESVYRLVLKFYKNIKKFN